MALQARFGLSHCKLFPNGLCVSPDGRSLIVAETGTGCVLGYAIGRNGALDSPITLIELGVRKRT